MYGPIGAIDMVARETMLFAAIGFFVGGVDDLLVDLLYFAHRVRQGRRPRPSLDVMAPPARPGRIAVFVPAWDEAGVIAAMLATTLARFGAGDYRIYVGVYPNDYATIAAVAAVARGEPRLLMVIGETPGPTTKADCLNTLWHALLREDARSGRRTKAVVLHDAEDVVHPAELAVFDRLIEHHDVVQLPVLPLVAQRARFVSGHYADEFSEAHAEHLVVRTALGAGMPLAGVGCAIATDMLARIAATRGGAPFDAASLTEDYELGLRIAELGGRGVFARIAARAGEPPIAVRAYFPESIAAAVRQKARWMTGIALAGWDRTGWARIGAIGDHWMRMRDRRAPLAVLILLVAYAALVAWGAAVAAHHVAGTPLPAPGQGIRAILIANAIFLLWRLAMRVAFTGRAYGRAEALWAIPRMVVGNYIALLAARRAVGRYIGMLRGAPPRWDKTSHAFPDLAALPPGHG